MLHPERHTVPAESIPSKVLHLALWLAFCIVIPYLFARAI